MKKQITQLSLFTLTIAALTIGLLLIFIPNIVNDLILRGVGTFLLITAIPLAAQFYKQYAGKKVVKEFMK